MSHRSSALPVVFAAGWLILAVITGVAAWTFHDFAAAAQIRASADAEAFADRAFVARNLVLGACLVATALTLFAAVHTAREFAARLKAEDAALISEQRYRLLAEHSGDIISLHETDGRISYVSPAVASVLGSAPESFIGQPTVRFIHPEDAAVWNDAVRDLAVLPVGRTATIRVQHAQGHYVWVETTARAIFEVGRPTIILATSRDVTQRKEVEEQLARSRQFAQQLAEVLPNLLAIYDVNQRRAVYVNPAVHRLLGRSPGEVLGPRDWLAEGCHPDDLPKVRAAHAKLDQLPGGSVVETEFRHRHSDGSYRWLVASETAYARDADGRLVSVLSMVQDQTERRAMADELRRSELRLTLALESTQDGLWDWDLPSGTCYYSPRWKEMLGYDPDDDLTTQSAWESLVHPDDLPVLRVAVREHFAGRSPVFECEIRARHRRTGEWLWILSRGRVAARDDVGRPLRLIGTNSDVTERKAAEERFRLLFDYASDPHFILDEETGIIDCNRSAVELLGAPDRAAILGRHYAQFSPEFQPDGLASIDRAAILDAKAGRDGPQRFDWLFQKFDGTELPCEVTLTPAPLDGRTVLLVTWHDLTERLRADAVTRAGEAQTRGLLDANRDCLLELDLEGRVQFINDGGREQLELADEAAILGRPWAGLWPDDHRADAELALASARGGSVGRFQGYCPTFTGHPKWWDVQVTAVRDADGRVQSLLCSSRDLTELKLAMAAADEARLAALEAGRAKCEFLAGMHHEINGPLSGITGLARIAADGASPELADLLNGVAGHAKSLRAILNDVLDFARIEAGGLEFEANEFGLRETVGEALAGAAGEAHAKAIELVFAVQPGVPDRLVGDAPRLVQVLSQLIGSSIRATERGAVVVRVGAGAGPPPEGPAGAVAMRIPLEFQVIDTSPDGGRDRLAGLSEAFTTTMPSRPAGESGLGLLICARLVERMNGRLIAEPRPGHGCVFRFTASFARPTVEMPNLFMPELRGKRVAVVEDQPAARDALLDQLVEIGLEPAPIDPSAPWPAAVRGSRFDLAVLDQTLPELDGIGRARALRGAVPELPVIVMTAGPPSRFRDAAADLTGLTWLAKPVQPVDLLDAVREALDLIPATRPIEGWSPIAPRLRVLLAEDHSVTRRSIARLLASMGHEVVTAPDGMRSVEAWKREPFDVILMDLQMPELDGYAATAVIRHLERRSGRRTRIVAMTSRAVIGDRRRAREAGMDDLLVKPIRRDELAQSLAPASSDPPTPVTF